MKLPLNEWCKEAVAHEAANALYEKYWSNRRNSSDRDDAFGRGVAATVLRDLIEKFPENLEMIEYLRNLPEPWRRMKTDDERLADLSKQ